MTGVTEAYGFRGRSLIDRDGDRIGKIDDVYYDEQHGGHAEWALVSTGLFGTKKTFVPLRDAHPVGEELRVPIPRSLVKDAPHIDADADLEQSDERRLFEHYNGAGSERREAGRMRLRKHAVTDGSARL